MSFILLIAEFTWKILIGEVWSAWQSHKQRETDNTQNDAQAMSGKQAQQELDHWRR